MIGGMQCVRSSMPKISKKKSQKYKDDLSKYGFDVRISKSVKELAKKSNLIITTTSSENPLIHLHILLFLFLLIRFYIFILCKLLNQYIYTEQMTVCGRKYLSFCVTIV